MSSKNIAAINRIYEAFGVGTFSRAFQPFVFPLEDHVAIEHLIDGGDRIAVAGRAHGTIRDGGSFDVPMMHLWEFQDGLAVRLEIVLDVPMMQTALAP